jgi:glycosyltransferase
MAPTVAELVATGHDVRVGCPESFAPFVRKLGFDAMPCRESDVTASVSPPPPVEDHDGRLHWAVTESWPADCRSWVDCLVVQAADWAPDLVLVEPVEHAGRVAASALGRPWAVHGWGFSLPGDVDEVATAGILDVYDAAGTAPSVPRLVVDLGPASTQAPDIGSVQRYRYRPFPVPGPRVPARSRAEPRVLVTMGTYPHPEAAARLRSAARAALDGGAEVIAVLGHEDRRSPEPFDGDVTVLDWVDMDAAVRTCDLVIHHGGAGVSWTALSHGVPAVVLPLAGDQYRNAQLLAAAGVATLCPSDAVDRVATAVVEALGDPQLRERAVDLACDNQRLPDVPELARHLARLADDSASRK